MILGIALPHQHLTWFATKIQAVKVDDSEISPPLKGKKVNSPGLKQTLQESLKDWDKKYARRYLELTMI